MVFASSIQKSQIPVGCQLCEGGNKIQWKCITCDSLMCDKCKDGVHLKITKDHRILNINDIGKQELSKDTIIFSDVKCDEHSQQACCLFCNTCNKLICPKCITKVHNGHELIEEEDYKKGKVEQKPKQKSEIKLEISKEYTTDLTYIHFIAVCSDGSMWMADNIKSKLQHVKLMENRTEVITSLNTQIYGIATTHSNDILVTTTGETKLKLINTMTGQITDSRYDVKPLYPVGIHVTSDHRVIIGGWSGDIPCHRKMCSDGVDQEGKQLQEYEHDKHNKPLITYPVFLTNTSNGNICVVDWLDKDHRSRVVVLSPGGDILGTYTGHPDVNTKKKPFNPGGILTTPSDNIVVTDMDNHLLHILSDQGQMYYLLQST
ncbi:TRIM71 [Mytilus coruscus]|uniref:TRIM71 n=1 Tax=Mytilus coruscus TaxID=42192 RepID=A0A6J8BFW8_MYTCO|nr:TRIM71 [Mytilus coruscus]